MGEGEIHIYLAELERSETTNSFKLSVEIYVQPGFPHLSIRSI